MADAGKAVRVIRKAVRSTVAQAAEAALAKVEDLGTPGKVPGVPTAKPPSYEEPTKPIEALPPKPDQAGPDRRTATGAETLVAQTDVAQQGRWLTTNVGVRLRDTDHSLKAGDRGPTLLQDHHLREKITHFDHERIPERVVHARGAGAHGVFIGYGNAKPVCRAGFLARNVETPVFVRFSTVIGNRGSMDTARDTRGFATKFYTSEGNFDLVANNIPVFFIQDGIKFPDVVHAAKPHPDREIPQAQSAHDTFWDFVSLHTEAQHHTMWNMSDRGIPRSYRMMEGFGVHTFRVVNADGETSLVKFHWKPKLGVHSITWEEAQLLGGVDPDYHRRDLADAIESGAYPQWELGLQVFPDTPEETFEGIDLLDPTKMVPEELAPVQAVGLLTLTGNNTNYFAETEQVAFHVGNLVPGIDVTNDALLQARLFSYVDTQLLRLGGPNYNQIPINRPHAPVNDMFRDGFHQDAVHGGVAPYKPNSLDGGCPFFAGAGAKDDAFVDVPVPVVKAVKERKEPNSRVPQGFSDHFSQARQFYLSMTPTERQHIVLAYTFELSRCYEQTIKERQLEALANIDRDLCREVATGLGLPAPKPTVRLTKPAPSPALSQLGQTWPVEGRLIGIVVGQDDEEALAEVKAASQAILEAGALPLVVAAHGGVLPDGTPIQRTFGATRSVEFDAVVLAGSPPPAPDALPVRDSKAGEAGVRIDPRVVLLVQEAFRHAKVIGATGPGVAALPEIGLSGEEPGLVTGTDATTVVAEMLELLGAHRVWERFVVA